MNPINIYHRYNFLAPCKLISSIKLKNKFAFLLSIHVIKEYNIVLIQEYTVKPKKFHTFIC